MKRKSTLYIVTLTFGLLLLSDSHLDYSIGDYIFNLFGLSPWTDKDQTGLHIPALIGFSLLFTGVLGTANIYRPRYPKILSRLIIGCIAIILIFPKVSEKSLFLLKHNYQGINSFDYLKDESRCSFQTVELMVKANCSFTIYNYGKEDQVIIKPILDTRYVEVDIDLEEQSLDIRPHSKASYGVQFNGKQRNGTGFSGTMKDVGLEIVVDGIRKKFE